MAAATASWESAFDVDYIYQSAQDASCTAGNSNVVFDVRPTNPGGQYIARAFFPNDARSVRNVLIDFNELEVSGVALEVALRHELRPHARLSARAHAPRGGRLLRGQRMARADHL